MPRANWGIDASDVDDFDRDSVYKPYTGPIPPDAVYLFLIKKLQFVAPDRKKLPQLRVGLELVPREDADEERYAEYFIMDFLHISDKTKFRYVPFLDAIGVSGREFTTRTVTKEDGNIVKIGSWRNTGEEYVYAQLITGTDQDGNSKKEIRTYVAYEEEAEESEEEYDEYDEDPV